MENKSNRITFGRKCVRSKHFLIIAGLQMAVLASCEKISETPPSVSDAKKVESNKSRNVRLPPSDSENVADLWGRIQRLDPSEQPASTLELHKRLSTASVKEICSLLDATDLKSESNKSLILTAMMSLANKSPDAYIRYAVQLDPSSNILRANPLLRAVIKTDPNAVIVWLQQSRFEGESASVLASSLLKNLVEVMPEVGIGLANQSNPSNREELLLMGYKAWGDTDPETALANIGKSFKDAEFVSMASVILEGTASQDPARAYLLAERVGIDPANEVYSSIFSKWLGKEPKNAVAALSSLPENAIQNILSRLPKEMAEIGADEPDAAIGLLAKIELNDSSKRVFEMTSAAMSRKRPTETLDWLREIAPGEIRDGLMVSAYNAWASADAPRAQQTILSLGGDSRKLALQGLATALSEKDPKAALAFAGRLPSTDSGPYLTKALDVILRGGAKSSAEALADPAFNTDVVKLPEIQSRIERIGSAYAGESLDQGKAWVEGLDDGRRVAAVRGFMSAWVKTDPLAATAWLEQMSPGSAKDAGIRSLIAEIKSTDPETARRWEDSLSGK